MEGVRKREGKKENRTFPFVGRQAGGPPGGGGAALEAT